MLDLVTGSSRDCPGFSRREFLRVGGLSALGLSLPGFLRLQKLQADEYANSRPGAKGVNCIFMWMRGGPSHPATFPPNPAAPPTPPPHLHPIPPTFPLL